MQRDCKEAIVMLMEQEEIVLDRSTRLTNAKGRPELVGYWDGTLLAYAALVYIRWLLDTSPTRAGRPQSCVLRSERRLGPVIAIKLNCSVILGRILNTAIPSLPEKSCRIPMIGVSQCMISSL